LRGSAVGTQYSTEMAVGQQDNRQGISNGSIDVGAAISGQQLADKGPEEDVWDEERLEKALKILKEMHIQVSSLLPL
jgi:hypothetical protein